MNTAEVKDLCQKLGIQPSKKLGQNFLIDAAICKKIVQECALSEYQNIYEIGPGLGALTQGLLQLNKQLRLIELDNKLAEYWQQQGATVIHKDALKLDWFKEINHKSLVVSNLPYQISSSIVIELSSIANVEKMVFMFQKEVAQRIASKEGSKNYGLLSIIAQTYWQIKKLVDAPARAFYPPPKIESRVLVFVRKQEFPVKASIFIKFLKSAFSQRRKLLSKNLKGYTDEEKLIKAFIKLAIPDKARAEELSVEQFQQLFLELNNGN